MKISDVTLSLASPTENPWPEMAGMNNNVPVWISNDAEEALARIGRTWRDCYPGNKAGKILDRVSTPDGWVYCVLVYSPDVSERAPRPVQIYWSRGLGESGPETCVLLPSDCADPAQKAVGAVLAAVGARA